MLGVEQDFLHVAVVDGDGGRHLFVARRRGAAPVAVPIAAEVELYPGTLQVVLLRAVPGHGGPALPGPGARR